MAAGELIGGTLLERVSIKPDVVITSDKDLLELRNHTSVPVACTEAEEEAEGRSKKSTSSQQLPTAFRLGTQNLRFHEAHQKDADLLAKQKHLIPDQADLQEPLERVREALAETVKTVFSR